MGKGRDKRKKHEDAAKVAQRHERQLAKAKKGEKKADAPEGGTGGLDGEEDIAVTVSRLKKLEDKRKGVIERDLPGPPGPRTNVVFVSHPLRADQQEVIIFGGEFWDGVDTNIYNDLFIYNPLRNSWRQVITAGGPGPRCAAQGWCYKGFLFIHGGELVSRTQAQFHHYRDTWRLDLDTCTWDELCTTRGSSIPSGRSGHRIAPWRSRQAVLFGGFYDNAQESRYFNDVWILSDLDGTGSWSQLLTPPHLETPAARSGHAIAVHEDTMFIYGGFSTEKLNRFQKTQATVYRDLWTLPLGTPTPMWTKVKLGGIPPPIRSGLGFAVKDKKMYLFGGVVDIDGVGGRSNSSFENDLFVLHLDTMKFFPLVLKQAKGGAAASGGKKAIEDIDDDPNSLLKDLKDTLGSKAATVVAPSEEPSAPKEPTEALMSAAAKPIDEPLRVSHVTLPSGQVLPCRRMKAAMLITGHTLALYGGQYEVGKKEITLRDLYALNLNRMDTYQCLVTQDLTSFPWQGHDSDSDAGSWEDGSTVADLDDLEQQLRAQMEDEEEEENDDNEDDDDDDEDESDDDDDDDDDDDAPKLIPAPKGGRGGLMSKVQHADPMAKGKPTKAVAKGAAATSAAPPTAEPAQAAGRTKTQGKSGLQSHKAQLEAQLSANALVPTPTTTESIREFFLRTEPFWLQAVKDAGIVAETDSATGEPRPPADVRRESRGHALEFCQVRYDEAVALLEQLEKVAAQEKQEMEQLRKVLAERRRLRELEDAAGD